MERNNDLAQNYSEDMALDGAVQDTLYQQPDPEAKQVKNSVLTSKEKRKGYFRDKAGKWRRPDGAFATKEEARKQNAKEGLVDPEPEAKGGSSSNSTDSSQSDAPFFKKVGKAVSVGVTSSIGALGEKGADTDATDIAGTAAGSIYWGAAKDVKTLFDDIKGKADKFNKSSKIGEKLAALKEKREAKAAKKEEQKDSKPTVQQVFADKVAKKAPPVIAKPVDEAAKTINNVEKTLKEVDRRVEKQATDSSNNSKTVENSVKEVNRTIEKSSEPTKQRKTAKTLEKVKPSIKEPVKVNEPLEVTSESFSAIEAQLREVSTVVEKAPEESKTPVAISKSDDDEKSASQPLPQAISQPLQETKAALTDVESTIKEMQSTTVNQPEATQSRSALTRSKMQENGDDIPKTLSSLLVSNKDQEELLDDIDSKIAKLVQANQGSIFDLLGGRRRGRGRGRARESRRDKGKRTRVDTRTRDMRDRRTPKPEPKSEKVRVSKGKQVGKTPDLMSNTKAKPAGPLARVGNIGAKAGGALSAVGGGAMTAISKLALPLAAGMALWDAKEGWDDTEAQQKAFKLSGDEDVTTGQKASYSLASALDMGGLFSGATNMIGNAMDALGIEGAQALKEFDTGTLARGIYSAGETIQEGFGVVTETFSSIWTGAFDTMSGGFESIGEKGSALLGAATSKVTAVFDKVAGWFGFGSDEKPNEAEVKDVAKASSATNVEAASQVASTPSEPTKTVKEATTVKPKESVVAISQPNAQLNTVQQPQDVANLRQQKKGGDSDSQPKPKTSDPEMIKLMAQQVASLKNIESSLDPRRQNNAKTDIPKVSSQVPRDFKDLDMQLLGADAK